MGQYCSSEDSTKPDHTTVKRSSLRQEPLLPPKEDNVLIRKETLSFNEQPEISSSKNELERQNSDTYAGTDQNDTLRQGDEEEEYEDDELSDHDNLNNNEAFAEMQNQVIFLSRENAHLTQALETAQKELEIQDTIHNDNLPNIIPKLGQFGLDLLDLNKQKNEENEPIKKTVDHLTRGSNIYEHRSGTTKIR